MKTAPNSLLAAALIALGPGAAPAHNFAGSYTAGGAAGSFDWNGSR